MGQFYPLALYGGISSGGGGGGTPTANTRQAYAMTPATDGTTTVFTVAGSTPNPVPASIDVFLNGVWQNPATPDYTWDPSGPQIQVTFTTAPATGDTPTAVY